VEKERFVQPRHVHPLMTLISQQFGQARKQHIPSYSL
jgi:hypothetical protein